MRIAAVVTSQFISMRIVCPPEKNCLCSPLNHIMHLLRFSRKNEKMRSAVYRWIPSSSIGWRIDVL